MKTTKLIWRGAALVGVALVVPVGLAVAATPPSVGALVAQEAGATAGHEAGGDIAQSRNAARSRMRECGHQWSTMKKNGTAAGMTWKDFSQGCLARQ